MTDALNIQSLFPSTVTAVCCRISHDILQLYPEEHAVVKNAVAKRQQEFAAGRACARRVLEPLGYPLYKLLKNPDGSPLWPHGIVGSIAHSHTWCAAAACRQEFLQGIGLDIETISRVSMNIASKVLTDQEMHLVADNPRPAAQEMLALIFSAKESVYKCLYPVCKKRLDFHDATIRPCPDRACFEVYLAAELVREFPDFTTLSGQYVVHDGNVFTGIVLPV